MKLLNFFYYFTIIFGGLLIVLSLLSLFHGLPWWYSKVLDFPRLQYWILTILFLIFFIGLNKQWKYPAVFFVLGLLASLFIHSVRIVPYWFGQETVPDASNNYEEDNAVSIMLSNILIKNKEYDRFLEAVQKQQPDVLLVMEVNQEWVDHINQLKKVYPYVISRPNEEAYGMILFSKLPLSNIEVKYLNHDFVPSFHADVELNSGKKFRFHGVHPVAPVPSGKYPDNQGEKEVALIKVGNMVAEGKQPSIVAGDFNDVSWSQTSRMFGHDGKLRNVRIGRGLFNSFDSTSKVMRWPLDHYFVTEEFDLVELQRLPEIGSDHFPMYAKFVLE